MTWADTVPNLLIGLREGLEAGLVVSILLAALHKIRGAAGPMTPPPVTSSPVWLGVLTAVVISGSYAAVLSFSTSALASSAQQAIAGSVSLLAVGLVTSMIFWMRRTAATFASHPRTEVDSAATIGAGALAITAFLVVGRGGLQTTLFLWTTVRASSSTPSPLLGAALGLAAAVALCALLYRQAVRIDLGKFFNRTAIVLIVIAAGILSNGFGELQHAGWLPGQRWVAFDLSTRLDANSWWGSIIGGVTELAPKMTVLQVVAWVTYLAVVIPMFVLAGRSSIGAKQEVNERATATNGPTSGTPDWWQRWAGRRPWPLAGALVIVPVAAAGVVIALLPPVSAASATAVTITKTACANEWTSGHLGAQSFMVDNDSGQAAEINLDDAAGAVVAEIDTIGPATTAEMTVTLGGGSYMFTCDVGSRSVTSSAPVTVSGSGAQATSVATTPTTLAHLPDEEYQKPNEQYQKYAAGVLDALAGEVTTIETDLAGDNLAAARRDWLTAQMTWERVGASYDSFGNAGLAVDGLPDGLPNGVNDEHFTGLHRLEYGLFHGQSATELLSVAKTLAVDVAIVQKNLTSVDIAGNSANLPIRAHEILEDALRDHLSGIDDEGAGAAYPETYADIEATQIVLSELHPLLTARSPRLFPTIITQLATLQSALLATRVGGQWRTVAETPLAKREAVDGAIGAVLESLSSVPDLLEVPPPR